MPGINLTVHLEYEEVVERLKKEDWVIPVRCKDCKHWDRSWSTPIGLHFCPMTDLYTDGDWFCAYGDRKEGDK